MGAPPEPRHVYTSRVTRPATLKKAAIRDRRSIDPRPERPHVLPPAPKPRPLSVNMAFRAASVRMPEKTIREKPARPVSLSVHSPTALAVGENFQKKSTLKPVTKLRATKPLTATVSHAPERSHNDVRDMDSKRCKERPTHNKGSGGSKAFVPWCEKRG